jgi:hypothetical protein
VLAGDATWKPNRATVFVHDTFSIIPEIELKNAAFTDTAQSDTGEVTVSERLTHIEGQTKVEILTGTVLPWL